MNDDPCNSSRQNTEVSVRVSAGMMLVAFAAAFGLTLWMRRYTGPVNERALFWGIVLPWATVARFPGAVIGSCLGRVARHALGWFAAIMTGMLTVVVLNYMRDPDLVVLLVRLRTGLIPTAVIFGILAATIAETGLSMLEMAWPKKSLAAKA